MINKKQTEKRKWETALCMSSIVMGSWLFSFPHSLNVHSPYPKLQQRVIQHCFKQPLRHFCGMWNFWNSWATVTKVIRYTSHDIQDFWWTLYTVSSDSLRNRDQKRQLSDSEVTKPGESRPGDNKTESNERFPRALKKKAAPPRGWQQDRHHPRAGWEQREKPQALLAGAADSNQALEGSSRSITKRNVSHIATSALLVCSSEGTFTPACFKVQLTHMEMNLTKQIWWSIKQESDLVTLEFKTLNPASFPPSQAIAANASPWSSKCRSPTRHSHFALLRRSEAA